MTLNQNLAVRKVLYIILDISMYKRKKEREAKENMEFDIQGKFQPVLRNQTEDIGDHSYFPNPFQTQALNCLSY